MAKEIRQFERTGATPSDALITAVLLLAAYYRPAHQVCNTDRLDHKVGVDLRSNANAKHDKALHFLVERRGGLDAISDQGIADLIFW